MIGQLELQTRLNDIISRNKFPRFTILTGPYGSGKKLMADKIAKQLSRYVINVDCKVDSIREMITQVYKLLEPTVYIIADADNMSENAKNAILKITEEPPNMAYIIMTLIDENNTLPTIRSRGTVYKMNPYSKYELEQYTRLNNIDLSKKDINSVLDVCSTPGQINKLISVGLSAFNDFVDLVFTNINLVSGSNAFKIGDKLAFKDEDFKYPLDLFWIAFSKKCLHEFENNPIKYAHGIRVTSKYLQQLRTVNLNKQYCFDMWLLDIREEWLNYADNM